jgi:phosphoglycolate phosphatase
MRLVLFDIDGTILWTDGAGRRAVHRALAEVFGADIPEGHEFDGKTDPQIVRELMVRAGSQKDEIDEQLARTLGRYVDLLQAELRAIDHGDKVFPGVARLLDTLEAREDVLLGLLTGNVRAGAMAKLSAVGIDPDRFRIGAFRASELLGREVSGSDVVVIGDTPADVGCGRGIGARAIGVGTGRYSVDDLRRCGAAAVFSDLSDTGAVVQAIMGG